MMDEAKYTRDSQLLNIDIGVTIPLAQACISGLICGALAAMVAYIIKWPVLTTAAAAAILATSFVWLFMWRWWRRMLDTMIGYQPADREPLYIGDAEPEPVSVRIELADSHSMQFIELPVSPDKLRALACGLMDGRSFTESSWCGSSGIFSRAEFVSLRDEMLKRGLLAANSTSTAARGYHLTRAGGAAIKYLATTHLLLESGSTDLHTLPLERVSE